MSAVAVNPIGIERSPGLWALAWKRLLADRIAIVSMIIVIFFFAAVARCFLWSRRQRLEPRNRD